MKYKRRDIQVFTKNVDTLKNENILNLSKNMHQDIYAYQNFEKIESVTTDKPKNIFQEYNAETYKIYKEISELLNEACEHYSVYKSRQNYFIKGKLFEYTLNNNNEIFDFPGRDVPVFHGFVVLGSEGMQQTYYTDHDKKEYTFSQNTITLSAPTNLINTKVKEKCMTIEYYLSPLSSILRNDQNLWIPIL
jgi:hypothetical protein